MQPQVELPSITAHKSGAFSVTSTPLEEVPTAGQVDDCILAEHYTPCGVLRATAPHAASQLHVHKLSSMLVMVKTVRLGELHTARQRHRAVTEWRLLRALYAAEGSNSSCQAPGSSNPRLAGLATHTFKPRLGQRNALFVARTLGRALVRLTPTLSLALTPTPTLTQVTLPPSLA